MHSTAVRESVRRPVVEVVKVADRHVECLTEFYRAVWDPSATAAGVRRARAASAQTDPAARGEEAPTFLYLHNGRPVGHLTTLPARLWTAGGERPAHWLKGLMVLPEYRNGPVGFSLAKEAMRHLGCTLAIAVQPAAWKLFCALGFAHVGVMSNHLRILRPARVLQVDLDAMGMARLPRWLPAAARLVTRHHTLAAVLGASASAMMQAWRAAAGLRWMGLTVTPVDCLEPTEVDWLWCSARGTIAAAAVRDSKHVSWRYEGGGRTPYSFVTVREKSKMAAFAVVRRPGTGGDPRLGGLRLATVSDILFAPNRFDAALAALAGAETAAREFGADGLLCSASHARLRAALPVAAYVPVPGNLHFLARDPRGAGALPATLDAWWLTRGDGDADEVF